MMQQATSDSGILPPMRQSTTRTPNASPTRSKAISSGIALTRKGELYAVKHSNGGRAPAPRLKIEHAIERHLSLVTVLLALLDEADGDPDVEPSLGAPEVSTRAGDCYPYPGNSLVACCEPTSDQLLWSRGKGLVEGEEGIDDEAHDEPSQDMEPSLGWTSAEANLGQWAPTCWPDHEDSIGSKAVLMPDGTIANDLEGSECGRYFVDGGGSDDNGIGDDGGRCEQYGVAT